MSVGGRGNSSRGSILKRSHAPLPNLSVSGKREIKCEPTGYLAYLQGYFIKLDILVFLPIPVVQLFVRKSLTAILWEKEGETENLDFSGIIFFLLSRTKKTRRGEKRDRGRCGRNRGRETGRRLFIEQQGIFSSGLNDDGRNNQMKSSVSNG